MQTYSFDELSTDAQEHATGLYWADADYCAFQDKVQEKNPDEFATFGDFAREANIRFNLSGERAA